jgi:adenine specific DNA methylase Mod
MPNTLYYGDNLQVLRDHVSDESVDLVYLDPPFNSNASYNVLFREKSGEESPAQIKAFTDTWEWTLETERTFEQDIILHPATPPAVKEMIEAFRRFIGQNALMAYLVMMTPRLVELRRVLKPTGSLPGPALQLQPQLRRPGGQRRRRRRLQRHLDPSTSTATPPPAIT